jgi:protein-tyrosine phosphatase
VLGRLVASGITPIVAHPERYKNIDAALEKLREWKSVGAYLQLNAGSLVGAYGKPVEALAWKCVRLGVVDYLCSDYHSRGKLLIGAAEAALARQRGETQLHFLSEINGERLQNGSPPLPVPPLKPLSLRARLGLAFRRH